MENENSYYKQPEQQTYDQPEQQAYGQPNQQTYGQPNQQTYGQPNQQAYGQPNQQVYGANYGQNTGYGMPPVGPNGQPLKNNYAMKLTFSILEILCCCICNAVTVLMGILGCIFTSKANNSYKQGKIEEFKSESKTATICLWVGFGFFVLEIIGATIFAFLTPSTSGGAPYVGGIGEAIHVEVDGETISVPSDYETLNAQGFSLDEYDAGTSLDGNGDFGLYQMVNKDGEYVMWCWFYNDSSKEKPLEECAIIGIDVDYNCENYEVYKTSEGLGFFDTPDDFIATYGTPDETEYDGDEVFYAWYFDNGSDPVWRVMEVTFREDLLYDIDVDYKE